jgi:hypothetical protein
MNIGSEKPVNSFPFRGTVLEDIQKMAVTVPSIVSAIQNMTDCNTVCSMLQQLPPMAQTLYQGTFLKEAVLKNRYNLLIAMVKELHFSVDSVYHPLSRKSLKRRLFRQGTALFNSTQIKNRQMSKFLIQDLKADVNKTWFPRNSKTTCSVLTSLIESRDFDELNFFLVSVL